MSGTVDAWIAKADGDYRTAHRELCAPDHPNYDAVCFHAQQCIEKLMKAVLISKGVVHPHIHDLVQLSKLLQPHVPAWRPNESEMRFLSQGGVTFRYPDEAATDEDAREALSICDVLRRELLSYLRPENLK